MVAIHARAVMAATVLLLLPPPAHADEPPVAGAVQRVLSAGTVAELEIVDPVDSKANAKGDSFGLRLARDIVVDGAVLVPKGTAGQGEVIHAAKARAGGKPGELLLAARYLDFAGLRIPLRGFRFGGSGKDNGDIALATGIFAGMAAFLISGGEKRVPVGTPAHARVAADVVLPAPTDAPEVQTAEREEPTS